MLTHHEVTTIIQLIREWRAAGFDKCADDLEAAFYLQIVQCPGPEAQ
jgi:hypothetical protein